MKLIHIPPAELINAIRPRAEVRRRPIHSSDGSIATFPDARARTLNSSTQRAAANGVGNPFSFREAEGPFSAMDLQRILNSPPPTPKNDPFVGGIIDTAKI